MVEDLSILILENMDQDQVRNIIQERLEVPQEYIGTVEPLTYNGFKYHYIPTTATAPSLLGNGWLLIPLGAQQFLLVEGEREINHWSEGILMTTLRIRARDYLLSFVKKEATQSWEKGMVPQLKAFRDPCVNLHCRVEGVQRAEQEVCLDCTYELRCDTLWVHEDGVEDRFVKEKPCLPLSK